MFFTHEGHSLYLSPVCKVSRERQNNTYDPWRPISCEGAAYRPVKLQQSVPLVNSVAKPIHKIYPQKEEVREVDIDEADPTKVIRVGAFLSDEMQSQVISFLRANASTFPWTTSDMKGIDPIVASHELIVDPTFKPIR